MELPLDRGRAARYAELERLKRDIIRVAQAEQLAFQRVEAAEAEAERWRARARLALTRGDEDLARQALARAATFAERAAEGRAHLAELSTHVGELKRQLRLAEQRSVLTSLPGLPPVDPVEARFAELEREALRQSLDLEVQRLKTELGISRGPDPGTAPRLGSGAGGPGGGPSAPPA